MEPRDYVLAIDTSLSLRSDIASIVGAAKLFVTNVPPEHEVMLMRFISSDKINIEADFTSDKAKLIKAIENLYLEGGQSSIIDAVYLANDDIEKHTKGETNVRRALVLITDGDERQSFYTREQLIKRLRQTGLQVFTIGFTKSAQQRQRAEAFLNWLAQESGGNLYLVDRSTDMGLVIKEILFEMMAPYVIGYESTNPARDGTFRKVRVDVVRPTSGENLVAFVRKGYTAPMK